MTRPARRPGAANSKAVLAVVLTTVAIAAALGLVAVLSGGGGSTTTPEDDTTPPVPDITDLGGEDIQGMYIQLVDKDDPTRVEGEILAESFEPVDPSNREVVEPRAWFFLDDGRTAYVEADEGRFFIPPGSRQPEEGVLRGNVRVRLFPPLPNDARPDPEFDRASIDARFESDLRFDLRLGEISTPDRMTVTGERIDFAGWKVRAVLNEARQRITLLEVERGDYITFTPETDAPDETTTATAPTPTSTTGSRPAPTTNPAPSRPTQTAATPTPATQPADPPAIDLYRAVLLDGVVIEQLDRRINADRLDLWVRLFDRQFPLRDTAAATPPRTRSWSGTLTDIIVNAATAQADPPSDAPSGAATDALTEGPVTLRWTGPLRLDSLSDTAPPPELKDENLTLRFTADRTGLVTFADGATGAEGTAIAVDYRDTARRIELRGTAGTVRLESPEAGRIEGVSRMNIALDFGNVNVRGPGVLYAAEHESENPNTGRRRAIRWTDQADFDFTVVDGSMTDQLERATFLGRVEAFGDASELRGSSITAEFANDTSPTGESTRSSLSKLIVADADARDGRGGSLAGQRMNVWFADTQGTSEADPERIVVEGNVAARRSDGASIESQFLDTDLRREPTGRIVVQSAEATGDVRFTDGVDIAATADRLVTRPPLETATLYADEPNAASVTRGVSTITGPEIVLDGRDGRLRVNGAGTLNDKTTPGSDELPRAVDLAWSRSLDFDDRAGDVRVDGRIRGTIASVDETGIVARDRIEADRIRIELDPIAAEAPAVRSGATTGDRVRRATVFGNPGIAPGYARVEARRYAPFSAEESSDDETLGELLRVLALDGGEIRLLAREDRVVVPGPGRLVSLQNQTDDADDGTQPLSASDAARVLVEWVGGLDLERTAGVANLYNRVAVVHHRPEAGVTTELETETLELTFRERETGSGELVALDAQGAAWLRSGIRELLADRILYDADTGIARASATEGNRVTMFDGTIAAPVRAATLVWDLLRDQVTIDQPGGIATPR